MKHEWKTKEQCSLCLVYRTPELTEDDRCSGMVINRIRNKQTELWDKVRGIIRREDGALPKEALVHGRYYYGRCRNANIARWDGVKGVFIHWRSKFHDVFLEEIHCREDEAHFDVFDPYDEIEASCGLNPVPVSELPTTTSSE